MSRFLRYEPCPVCRSNGRDSRGDNCAHYSDGSAHCFACGYHEFVRLPRHLTDDTLKSLNAQKAVLPFDFTREVPATAWKWVLQYGFPVSYWKKYCGYSPSESRLVFTVGDPVAFSIGRLIGSSQKPTEPKKRKWYVWGDSHKHTEVFSPSEKAAPIILVEDIVSAHKVGQVTATVPLFGVSVHPCHLYYLKQAQRPIAIWLDKDQEGNIKKQARNVQMLTGCPTDIIVTPKDPKSYTLPEIKGIIYHETQAI